VSHEALADFYILTPLFNERNAGVSHEILGDFYVLTPLFNERNAGVSHETLGDFYVLTPLFNERKSGVSHGRIVSLSTVNHQSFHSLHVTNKTKVIQTTNILTLRMCTFLPLPC
jgi:hypothetical protein